MLTRRFASHGIVIACATALSACGGSSGDHNHVTNAGGHDHSHGVSDIQPGVWPPTLTDITDEKSIAPSKRKRGAGIVVATARKSVMNNPLIQSDLGSNFAEFEASAGDEKSGVVASFVFYNYDTNSTIDVAMFSDGSLNHVVYPASEYQPSENADEVQTAIAIASASFEQGGVDLSALTGTAMLAYPGSDGGTAASTAAFYDERLLYVTFGEGNGVLPNYRALVNLSQNSVVEQREIK